MNRVSPRCISMVGAIFLASLVPCLPVLAGTGDVDSSYGTGGLYGSGVRSWPQPSSYSHMSGPIALADGRMIVLKSESGVLYSQRVNLDGRLDAGFGNNGTERISMHWGALATASAPDGSSFIASGNSVPAVARLRPDGTLDTAFGAGGVATVEVGSGSTHLEAVAALKDGGAVALWVQYGLVGHACATQVRLVRLGPDGQIVADVPVEIGLFNFVDCMGWFAGYESGNGASMRSLAGDLIQLTLPHKVLFFRAGDGPSVPQPLTVVNPPATLPASGIQGADETHNYMIQVAPAASLQARLIRLHSDLAADSGFGTEPAGGVLIDFSRVSGVASTWLIDDFATSIFARDPQFIYVSAQLRAQTDLYPQVAVIVRLFKDGRVDTSFGSDGFALTRGGTYTFDPYGVGGGGGRVIGVQSGGRALVQVGGAVVRTLGHPAASAGVVDLFFAPSTTNPRGQYPYFESVGAEEGTSAVVKIARTLGSSGALSLNYRLSSTTATSGVDYGAVSGTLTWADGESGFRIVTIPVAMDLQIEQGEAFDVIIEATGPAVLLNNVAHYAIVDRSTGSVAPPVTTPPVVTPPVVTPPAVIPPIGSPATPDDGSSAGILPVVGPWMVCYSRFWGRCCLPLRDAGRRATASDP